MPDAHAAEALLTVRVLVMFQGGHFVATYPIGVSGSGDVEACVQDACARAAPWPFLWVSAWVDGRLVLHRTAQPRETLSVIRASDG